MVKPRRIHTAEKNAIKNEVGQIRKVYGTPVAEMASVYPITNAVVAQMYGTTPDALCRLIMAQGADVALEDGVWLEAATDTPPDWVVVSVLKWPRHTEVTVKKVI